MEGEIELPGAVIFATHCSGCHTLSAAGTHPSHGGPVRVAPLGPQPAEPGAQPGGDARAAPDRRAGALREVLAGADVFVGVSGPGILEPADIATMAGDAIVFALANPDPEVDPAGARRHAAVVATGRSDEPNQINNVLAFPGVFRGALDAGARAISEAMKVAAARAIAARVADDELRPDYIVPSVFDKGVAPGVAAAVRQAADGA